MTLATRFEPPSIATRGKLANLRAAAQAHKPQHGEAKGTLRCTCGAVFRFTIQANGISWGSCSAACGTRWCS